MAEYCSCGSEAKAKCVKCGVEVCSKHSRETAIGQLCYKCVDSLCCVCHESPVAIKGNYSLLKFVCCDACAKKRLPISWDFITCKRCGIHICLEKISSCEGHWQYDNDEKDSIIATLHTSWLCPRCRIAANLPLYCHGQPVINLKIFPTSSDEMAEACILPRFRNESKAETKGILFSKQVITDVMIPLEKGDCPINKYCTSTFESSERGGCSFRDASFYKNTSFNDYSSIRAYPRDIDETLWVRYYKYFFGD